MGEGSEGVRGPVWSLLATKKPGWYATDMKKKAVKPKKVWPVVKDTFGDPTWRLDMFDNNSKPSAFNGMVHFRRYRITVDLIDEPKEILIERLKILWENETNSHQYDPIRAAALGLGCELEANDFGKLKRKVVV